MLIDNKLEKFSIKQKKLPIAFGKCLDLLLEIHFVNYLFLLTFV